MGIARNPVFSLACVTCTHEVIYDGVALAQVAVVITGWPNVMASRGQRRDSERCERDETTRLVDARQNK
jgi:hypothetical protein